MKGRSFKDVWDNEPSWVGWTAAHMTGQSQSQRRWLEYIEMKLEEVEAADEAWMDEADADWELHKTGGKKRENKAALLTSRRPKPMPRRSEKASSSTAESAQDREAGLEALVRVGQLEQSMTSQMNAMNATMQQIIAALQSKGD